jgi:predicted Fe-Mo cluster-binding NifX family protein
MRIAVYRGGATPGCGSGSAFRPLPVLRGRRGRQHELRADRQREPVPRPRCGNPVCQSIGCAGVQFVLTGNCGPNAHQTLTAANIGVIVGCSGTVRGVVEQFAAGQLQPVDTPNVPGHSGMSAGESTASGPAPLPPATTPNTGRGSGRGMGEGQGRGMGRGRRGGGGRGMGRGRGGGR